MSKSKRIALCIPNFSWQEADLTARWHLLPYGLCLIAATIRELHSVEIIDANMEDLSPRQFKERIRKGNYDLVGISVLMDVFAQSGFQAAKLSKEAIPNVIVVMGGVFPTVSPADVLSCQAVSYAVIGEGEVLFRQLVEYLWHDGAFPERGLAYRDENEKMVVQSRADLLVDLDSLPLPAYDLIDFNRYAMYEPRKAVTGSVLVPYGHIMTSRGCPQSCCFCQVEHISGRRFRPRSPGNILHEIAWLKSEYGVRSLLFDDDNIITQRNRALELFRGMVDSELAMPWKAMAMAVFQLDEELIDAMADSGCTFIGIAIESGSPRVLKEIINKPINLEHAKKMVAYARSRGVFVSANYMIGFPGETWEEIRQTIRVAEELDTDYAKIFTVIPLRNTRLWDMCVDTGSFASDFDPKNVSWNEGQIASPYFDQDELTLLRAYEWDRINFSNSERRSKICEQMRISNEELEVIRRDTRNSALSRLRTPRSTQ